MLYRHLLLLKSLLAGGNLSRKRLYTTAAEKQSAYRKRKLLECGVKPVTIFVPLDPYNQAKDGHTELLVAFLNNETVNSIGENLSSAVDMLSALNDQGAFEKLREIDLSGMTSVLAKLEAVAVRFKDITAAVKHGSVIARARKSTGTGTKEWAANNINFGLGCAHGCKYCYAMFLAERYKKTKSREDWSTETVNLKKIPKGYRLREGVLMFPSSHDITPYYLPYALDTLKKLLAPGNRVLIVSKPHIDCIKTLCDELKEYKNQIVFRFTIGTLDSAVSRFWEPGAPEPAERIESLKLAFESGFATSVSMEPMLTGIEEAIQTFQAVSPYITDTVWFGKLNKKGKMSTPEDVIAFDRIKKLQSDAEILRLVSILKGTPKVQWKDSIKKVIAKSIQPTIK